MNKDLAMLYGVLLGDGCLSKVGNSWLISITCDIHTDQPFFKKITPKIEKIRGKNIKTHYRHKCGKIEMNFSDKKLFCKLNSLGFPIGKKGPNLCIPKKHFNHMQQIIQGYFATDGCLVITNNNGTVYPRIEFSSISKKLLEQVKDYLDLIGINGSIYISHKINFRSTRSLYRLQINGKKKLFLFEKKIGFLNPKHVKRYKLFT